MDNHILSTYFKGPHFKCWLLFVHACAIISQRIVKQNDVATADLLLLSVCKFEQLYGREMCTPNIHLHLHKDCLLDYRPSHAFWCFSFKRYNGLLGSFHMTHLRTLVFLFSFRHFEKMFLIVYLSRTSSLYSQLYPCQVVTHISLFYIRVGCALLCNQVIGSVVNSTSCNLSSVIMAYWPTGGSISNVDYSCMRVGKVHYCKH